VAVEVKVPETKVRIGNISNGQTSVEFTKSLLELLTVDIRNGWNIYDGVLWKRSNVNVSRGRNEVIKLFLDESSAEWLLLLDSDMVFPSDILPRLLISAQQANAKVMGGLCVTVHESIGPYPTLYHLDNFSHEFCRAQLDYPENAILQVSATGAACLLVHREVLEAIRRMHIDNRQWLASQNENDTLKEMLLRGLVNAPSEEFGWFSEHAVIKKAIFPDGTETTKEHWLGEDIDFCLKIGAAGYEVFVDCSLHIGHHKGDRIWYPSDIKDGVGFSRPKIVAVIPVKDQLELTSGIVHQLREQANCDEIVICDNGSGTKTKNWLSSQDDLTVFDCPGWGIHEMWNYGLSHALEKYGDKTHIAFLNNDLKLGDSFLDRLSLALYQNREMVAVCGNYDGRTYSSGVQETVDICANRYDGTGGFAGFAFMVRGEWFAGGYRFPEECKWWFGDNHLLQAIQIGNANTKDIPRKAGIVINADVIHLDGGGKTAGDPMWSKFAEQLEVDRLAYENIWKTYADQQLRNAYDYLCNADSDIREHLPTFVSLCEELEAKKVIELGVRSGVSTIAWLYGVSKTDGHLWSVDINPQPPNINHDRWTFVQGDDLSNEVLEALPSDADVVFIDTDHRYELTKAEIAEYSLRVRAGGVMVFHDVNVKQFDHHELGTEPLYPVRKAVQEWVDAEGLECTMVDNCYGLAVVRL
jgi:predicted O-methyltransferase YrrM/GT2 family glycosyltransferase